MARSLLRVRRCRPQPGTDERSNPINSSNDHEHDELTSTRLARTKGRPRPPPHHRDADAPSDRITRIHRLSRGLNGLPHRFQQP